MRETIETNINKEALMEIAMHQPTEKDNSQSSNNTKGTIEDIIKHTPDLEQYIVANILTKCGKPEGYEGKRKFTLYKGWDTGNCQRGRVCFYHKRYDKQKDIDTMAITSYFFTTKSTGIGIHLPKSKGKIPDITIDYPTNG